MSEALYPSLCILELEGIVYIPSGHYENPN